MSTIDTILKVENLSAGYGSHNVLNKVSFSMQKGEALVIIGQNGSGKSTLLKTICGLINPKAGNIWLHNHMERHISPCQLVKNGFSYFVQGGLIMPALSVKEHLELAAKQRGGKLGKTMLDDIFAEFHSLKEMLNKKAGNLSGGERQLLSFAILQVQHTDTWLLDEPTAGLSPEMVRFSIDFLQRKIDEGITMLIVEHNMDVAFKLATHIAITKETTLTRKFDKSEFQVKNFLDKYIYN